MLKVAPPTYFSSDQRVARMPRRGAVKSVEIGVASPMDSLLVERETGLEPVRRPRSPLLTLPSLGWLFHRRVLDPAAVGA